MSTRANGRLSTIPQPKREGGHVVEMQRRRLLLAIGEVVSESGLETATVGRVCEQAGVSRRTFYELFSDREACLLAAFDQAIEQITQRIAPAFACNGSWRERVRATLLALLEHLDAEPDVARLCVVEVPRAGPELLERRRQVLEALAAAADEGRRESRAGAAPPPLTAEGVVGGALSVIHARLLASKSPATETPRTGRATRDDGVPGPLVELTGPLMAMIVHPYLGPAVARKELKRPTPATRPAFARAGADPFKGLPIRFTYRTARVLSTIALEGGRGSYPSNRHIADSSGIADEGQMSRLLRRLDSCGLIENRGDGHTKGEPNAWRLTPRGEAIHATISRAASN
jgi:AcrR family transcriptional regulator